jgi:TraX protein
VTSFQIKLLAALLMVCDHIGVVFFPSQLIFRYIGRFSFPLFAWLLGQGEKYTKDFNSYFLKLTVWGFLSQPIYYLLFNNYSLNILVTLLLSLLAIRLGKLIDNKSKENLSLPLSSQILCPTKGQRPAAHAVLHSSIFFNSKYLIWLTFALIAQSVNANYGAYGVIIVTILSEFNFTSFKWWLKWLVINSLVLIIPGFKSYQLLALLAPFIILLWNGKQGQKVKLFYVFYPLHLILLKILVLICC